MYTFSKMLNYGRNMVDLFRIITIFIRAQVLPMKSIPFFGTCHCIFFTAIVIALLPPAIYVVMFLCRRQYPHYSNPSMNVHKPFLHQHTTARSYRHVVINIRLFVKWIPATQNTSL